MSWESLKEQHDLTYVHRQGHSEHGDENRLMAARAEEETLLRKCLLQLRRETRAAGLERVQGRR